MNTTLTENIVNTYIEKGFLSCLTYCEQHCYIIMSVGEEIKKLYKESVNKHEVAEWFFITILKLDGAIILEMLTHCDSGYEHNDERVQPKTT